MHLSIAVALAFAVACKTDKPAASTDPAATEPSSGKPRSAKIDVKPLAPPSLPAAADGSDAAADSPRGNREDWRKRRDAKADANGDGVVSDEERDAAARERMTAIRARFDADGDGKLTPAELASAPGRMHFDDPAALDTNHDGDISADELAAGVKAKREQRRAARAAAKASDPTTP
jgi:hypothetical protein